MTGLWFAGKLMGQSGMGGWGQVIWHSPCKQAVKGTNYQVTQKNVILIATVTMVNTVTVITGF
jgi:hypothetical protein